MPPAARQCAIDWLGPPLGVPDRCVDQTNGWAQCYGRELALSGLCAPAQLLGVQIPEPLPFAVQIPEPLPSPPPPPLPFAVQIPEPLPSPPPPLPFAGQIP